MSVLGADIGASTIDLALLVGGSVRAAKIARGEGSVARELAAAIRQHAAQWSFDPASLDEIRIGSTGAVNMLLGRRVARVGLITTEGFADTLQLARQNRADLYDPVARSPAPTFLVAPGAIHAIEGRLDKDGNEIIALSVDQIRRAGETLRAQGVEAIAVCFLFSFVNPVHERLCADVLSQVAPGIPVVLSHEVDGNAREYERTVSACLEAALCPAQHAVLDEIGQQLSHLDFTGRLSFADSRGHLVAPQTARSSICRQLAGGPAASALFSARLAGRAGARQAIALDMGSTSTDIVLIDRAGPAQTNYGVVADVPLRTPMSDIHSIPIGGGARVTQVSDGGIRFSPRAKPDAPSLSDALVVLEQLPQALAPDARARLARHADEAGIDHVTLAAMIRDAALDGVVSSVVRYAVGRNVDPSSVPLIVGGGLGPVVACALAERLGTSRIVLDEHSAVSGAAGLLLARHVDEAMKELNTPLDDLADGRVAEILGELDATHPRASNGVLQLTVAPNAFMHPVTLTLGSNVPTVEMLRAAFCAYHTERFGHPSRETGFAFRIGRFLLEEPVATEIAASKRSLADFEPRPGWDLQAEGGVVRLIRQATSTALRPETLQMRLNAVAQTMQEMLFRTAVSPVVREGNDAAAALLTPEGELIALSDAIPLLLGALDGSARAILDHFPRETMREGDLFLMNDPFLGGTHLPDLTVMRPVFADGRMIALAASILHHQDVGGMRAGSVPPDAVDIFQEGLRLPPIRLGAADCIDPLVVNLFNSNSRAPDTVLGDLSSQIGAAVKAAALLQDLVGETGVAAFLAGMDECLERGRALAESTISTMAPGPHTASERLDPAPGLPEVKIALSLTCVDGRFRCDFTGTSAQVAAPINCVRSGPFAAAFYSLLSAMGDTVFRNGGVVRTIDLVLPDGCAINASPPAAVNARMGIVRSTTSALLQGLARALPESMPAANSGMSYVLAFSGAGKDGKRFIATEIIAGGAGGGPHHDGASGISTDVGNAMNMPGEALESQIPVRLMSACVRRASGGAGRFRGGDGIRRTYLALQDGIGVSLRGDRFRYVPEGLLGGSAPQPAAARIVRADGTIEELGSRSAPVLDRGDQLIVESCGGAGYGVQASQADRDG